ncbi:unnamed protein product, partial [Heterosigma akashiwo]
GKRPRTRKRRTRSSRLRRSRRTATPTPLPLLLCQRPLAANKGRMTTSLLAIRPIKVVLKDRLPKRTLLQSTWPLLQRCWQRGKAPRQTVALSSRASKQPLPNKAGRLLDGRPRLPGGEAQGPAS